MKTRILIIIGTVFALTLFSSLMIPTFADYVSPREQIKSGVSPVDIQCVEYRILVIRDNGSPACVTEKTAEKTGWSVVILTKQIESTEKENYSAIISSDSRKAAVDLKSSIEGRSFDDTIYSQKSSSFNPSRIESIISTDDDWCNYDYYVYDGKYNQLWIQVNPQEDNLDISFDREAVLTYLSTADYLYEEYYDLFGWEVIPGISALIHVVCQDVEGAGTGVGGTFYNFDEFDDVDSNGDMSQTYLYGTLVQEYLHLWDFRGGIYLQGPDSAHSFTAGMEPIIHSSIGSGQTWWIDGVGTTLPYDFIFNHWYKINLQRYLSDPQLSWRTYYSDVISICSTRSQLLLLIITGK